jgi:hypothetical protein
MILLVSIGSGETTLKLGWHNMLTVHICPKRDSIRGLILSGPTESNKLDKDLTSYILLTLEV